MPTFVKEASCIIWGRYFEKQEINVSVELLYWLVHLLVNVAPSLLFVLRMDFYCLILCK